MTREIPLTRGFVALVDDEDFEALSQRKWRVIGGRVPYAGTTEHKTRYMHRLLMTPPDGFEVDHINRNGLDNRRANLRLCTRSENMRNRSYARKSGGARGTRKHGRKFAALIMVDRRQIYLGLFDTECAAAEAYDAAALKHFGEFAFVNYPSENTMPEARAAGWDWQGEAA